MTTYAISSVNGDYQSLLNLLEKIQFKPEQDRLWFTGNSVNSGTESLAVLKLIQQLGKSAVLVLGAQELRLLGLAEGYMQIEATDTVTDILESPECPELLKWLRKRPFLLHDSKLNFTLSHAGIPAEWTLSQTLTFAYEVESVLAGSNYTTYLENRRQDQTGWHPKLRGWKRLNFISNAYTLMKYCNERGRLDFKATGAIAEQAAGLLPWYRRPDRLTANLKIIFSDTAGFADTPFPGIYPLPSHTKPCALKLGEVPEMISIAD
jgi:bis(5'-nucleosyl)-tetraphosphatase (symmetrical)